MEDRHLRKVEAAGSNPAQSIGKITNKSLEEYLSFLELKGVTKDLLFISTNQFESVFRIGSACIVTINTSNKIALIAI